MSEAVVYQVGTSTAGGSLAGKGGDAVNHPSHYTYAGDAYECIKVLEAWGLGLHLGNCVKYICRAGRKGDALEDLRKARWYLDRYISNLEAKK